jgi:glycerol-3-phosphate dehydrogenase
MRGADGRLMFAVPAGDFTYLGTTDTDYTGSLETVLADAADITYILEAANRTFAGSDLTEADIVSTWAGLRPLLRMPGDPSAVSRDYHLYTSRSGMVTVAGGKLTAFRAMASHIVDTVFPATRREKHLARSIAPLPGADLPPEAELAARVGYAVREEMAIRLADFCRRRTGLMLFAADNGRSLLDGAAALMGELLGWSEERKAGELAAVRSEIEAMFAWRRAAVAVP